MIGYICLPRIHGDDPADRLLRGIAHRLAAEGIALAGAVQSGAPSRAAKMQLELLGTAENRVISQQLGTAAGACRLDAGALELAVERILAALPAAQMVILNKYGKQEAAGRGMRAVIAAAVERDLPVLISVAPDVLDDFRHFTADMAEALTPDQAEAWCRARINAAIVTTAPAIPA